MANIFWFSTDNSTVLAIDGGLTFAYLFHYRPGAIALYELPSPSLILLSSWHQVREKSSEKLGGQKILNYTTIDPLTQKCRMNAAAKTIHSP
jgi:hypothetical protein